MVKHTAALISLQAHQRASKLTSEAQDLDEVISNGRGAREPPMAPEPFATELADGVASGAKGFTNKGDVGLVTTVYDKAFEKEMGQAVALLFANLKWSDAQGVALVGALRAAHERGGLQQLEKLDLSINQMGDETATALAALLEAGAMPKLEVLGAGCTAKGCTLRAGTDHSADAAVVTSSSASPPFGFFALVLRERSS